MARMTLTSVPVRRPVKRAPIRKVFKPPLYAIPAMSYQCEWWKTQTVRAIYRGVGDNSFALQRFGSKDLSSVALAPTTQREQDLWQNIADAMARVRQTLDHPPAKAAYWNLVPGSWKAARDSLAKASAALDQIISIYSEWRNQRPYWLLGWRAKEPEKKGSEMEAFWEREINWPLNERLMEVPSVEGAPGHGVQYLQLILPNLDVDYADVINPGDALKSIQRMEAEGLSFEEMFARAGRPSWTARREAIADMREEFEKAAYNARCAEVWTAFVVSYGRNKRLWEKKQAQGPGTQR